MTNPTISITLFEAFSGITRHETLPKDNLKPRLNVMNLYG